MGIFGQKNNNSLTVSATNDKVTIEDVARAVKEMKYEELLKMGNQFAKISDGERGVLMDMKPHDWVAFVHRWAQIALEKPVVNYYSNGHATAFNTTHDKDDASEGAFNR